MRLIDADALKQAYFNAINETSIGEVSIIDIIDNAPTVEPETKVVANVTFNKEQVEELVEKAKADILAQIERPQGEWIPISERLPEFTGLYLISVDDVVTVADFTGTYFMHRGGGRVKAYAWQPLPEPYHGEDMRGEKE